MSAKEGISGVLNLKELAKMALDEASEMERAAHPSEKKSVFVQDELFPQETTDAVQGPNITPPSGNAPKPPAAANPPKTADSMAFDLQKHDARFHPQGYRQGDTCKFREKMAEQAKALGIGAVKGLEGVRPDDASVSSVKKSQGFNDYTAKIEASYRNMQEKLRAIGQEGILENGFVKAELDDETRAILDEHERQVNAERDSYIRSALGDSEAECASRLADIAAAGGEKAAQVESKVSEAIKSLPADDPNRVAAEKILEQIQKDTTENFGEKTVGENTYVDVSGMGFWDSMRAAALAGLTGKGIITDYDKMSGRWQDIQMEDPKLKAALEGLKAGVGASILEDSDKRLFEALDGMDLDGRVKDDIKNLRESLESAKTPAQKIARRKQIYDYLSERKIEVGGDGRPKEEEQWKSVQEGTPDASTYDASSRTAGNPAAEAYHQAVEKNRADRLSGAIDADEEARRNKAAKDAAVAAGFDPDYRSKAGPASYMDGLNVANIFSTMPKDAENDPAAWEQEAQLTESSLGDFLANEKGLDLSVTGHSVNGSDTSYTIKLGDGVSPRTVAALKKDIENRYAQSGIRIDHVGDNAREMKIYIPHGGQDIHGIRETLSDPATAKQVNESGVPVILGKMNGKNVVIDLAGAGSQPHAFIGGSTKSGKSVMAHNLVAAWLLQGPNRCRPFIIDPKGTEFDAYKGIKGVGLAQGDGQVESAVDFLISEMNRRDELLRKAGARNIQEYNARHPDAQMPYMPIIFDEMESAMRNNPQVKDKLASLLAKCRYTGMHMVGLSQGASPKDIPNPLMKNFGHRIGFKVPRATDSNNILGTGHHEAVGAKMRGDGFYTPDTGTTPKRMQSPFISDNDIAYLVEWRKARDNGQIPPKTPPAQPPSPQTPPETPTPPPAPPEAPTPTATPPAPQTPPAPSTTPPAQSTTSAPSTAPSQKPSVPRGIQHMVDTGKAAYENAVNAYNASHSTDDLDKMNEARNAYYDAVRASRAYSTASNDLDAARKELAAAQADLDDAVLNGKDDTAAQKRFANAEKALRAARKAHDSVEAVNAAGEKAINGGGGDSK